MSRISKIGENIEINLDKQTVNCAREEYSFKTKNLLVSLLEYFCNNPNIVLSNQQICEQIYHDDYDYGDKRIKNLISRLRKEIVPSEKYPEFANAIQTKAGGYMYTGSRVFERDEVNVCDDNDNNPSQKLDSIVFKENETTEQKRDTSVDSRSDDEVIAESLGSALNVFAAALKTQNHEVAERIRNNKLYNAFRNDYDQILKYCINTDPSAEPISIYLHDEINNLKEKWVLDIQKVSDTEKYDLMQETLLTLSEYTYYLSDEFLRLLCDDSDRLIYRNSSAEEGNRLMNELRPKTFELRQKMQVLYNKLWSSPKA